jgi:hypothetical protein
MTLEQQEKGAELLKTLAQKAWESTTFKEQLISNPEVAIEQVIGKKLTNFDKKIVVEDQTDESVIYLNIPAQPKMDELELTEEELEQVAGGITPTVTYVVGVAAGLGICWLVDRYL